MISAVSCLRGCGRVRRQLWKGTAPTNVTPARDHACAGAESIAHTNLHAKLRQHGRQGRLRPARRSGSRWHGAQAGLRPERRSAASSSMARQRPPDATGGKASRGRFRSREAVVGRCELRRHDVGPQLSAGFATPLASRRTKSSRCTAPQPSTTSAPTRRAAQPTMAAASSMASSYSSLVVVSSSSPVTGYLPPPL